MFNYGIIRRIVGNIPAFCGYEKRITSGQEYKTVVEKLPETRIDFLSDRMDFSECFTFSRGARVIIDWHCVPQDARYLVKMFNLDNMDKGNKITTEKTKARMLGNIIRVAEENNPRHEFQYLNERDIIFAVESLWKDSMDCMKMGYAYVERFIDFVRKENLVNPRIDLREIRTKRIQTEDLLPGRKQRRHSPVIPEKMFQAFLDGFYRVMTDKTVNINDRMTAGMCLLNTQLGLRISEIPALEVDCLKYYVNDRGEKDFYIVYNTIKPASADIEVFKTKTICTPLAKSTIEYLLNLRKRIPGSGKYPYLYCLDGKNCRIGRIYDKDAFMKRYKRLCALYLYDIVSRDWDDIKRVSVRDELRRVKPENQEQFKKPLSIPGIHSFRSTFASKLYLQGFDVDYINAIMSHTPQSDSSDAYVPPKVVKIKIDKDTELSDMFEEITF